MNVHISEAYWLRPQEASCGRYKGLLDSRLERASNTYRLHQLKAEESRPLYSFLILPFTATGLVPLNRSPKWLLRSSVAKLK